MIKRSFILLAALCGHAAVAQVRPVATVHIHKPSGLVADATALATALEAPLEQTTADKMLSDLVLVEDTAGVDFDAPIEMFYYQNATTWNEFDPVYAVRFKVTGNGDDYLGALDKSFAGREDLGGGLHRLSWNEQDGRVMWMSITNGVVVYCEKREFLPPAPDVYSPSEATYLHSVTQGVSIILNPNVVDQDWFKALEDAHSGQDVDPATKAMVDILRKYIEPASRQINTSILHLDLSGGLTLSMHVKANTGSFLEKVMAASAKPSPVIAGYSDDRALFSGFGTLGGLDLIMPKYADFVSDLYRAFGPPMDSLADDFRQMIMSYQGVFTGGYNFLIYPGSTEYPIAMAGSYEVADANAAKEAFATMIQLQERMAARETNSFYTQFTKQEVAGSSYQGVEIESYRVSVHATGIPNEAADHAMDDYLKDSTYCIAYVDNLVLFSLGSREYLERLIDFVQAGEPAPRALPVFAADQDAIDGYWEIDLSKLTELDPGKAAALGMGSINARIQGISMSKSGGYTAKIRLTEADLRGIRSLAVAMFAMKSHSDARPVDESSEMYFDEEEGEPGHYVEEEINWYEDQQAGEEAVYP